MAIQNANFNANGFMKSSGKRVITCTSDKVGALNVFNYRFYLRLTVGVNTYDYLFRPNNEDYGIINITKILQTLVAPINTQQVQTVPEAISDTGTINDFKQNLHTIPHNKRVAPNYVPQYLSTGGTTSEVITAQLSDFYGDTATEIPTKRATGAVSDILYVISGYDIESDLINVSFTPYRLTNTTQKLLNNNYNFDGSSYNIETNLNDYGTIALLNRTKQVNTTAEPQKFVITYKNSSDVTLATQVLDQSETYGGKYDALGVNDDSIIIYAGLYPANLDKLPDTYDRPSDYPTLSYYRVQVGNTALQGKSAVYRFNIVEPCEKYDKQRFAFINSFGVWEYINFFEKRTDNISAKNTTIKKSVLDYTKDYSNAPTAGYEEGAYVPNVAHYNEQTVATNFNETFTVNTGYLENHEVEKVKDMFLSSQINYLNSDGSARAVILQSSSIKSIKNINKHYEQVNYSLTFKYSVPTYNNIIY